MRKLRADLHIHTYYSDGVLSPEEVFIQAKRNGVEFAVVTDHDCISASAELFKCAESAGIKTVKGIEVSAYAGDVKIHTLGYNVDADNPVFADFLKELYDGSYIRSQDILDKLNKNGVKISMDEVTAGRAVKNSPLHVMHIAFACAKKGYCGGNPFDFFSQYLAYGKCAYSNVSRPTPEKACEIIKACGGVSSLAHPGRIDLDRQSLIKLVEKMKGCGLGGIEAVYSTHTVTETAYYKEMAKTYSLMVTGGSDTHFPGGKRKIGSPEYYLDEVLADRLGL